MGRRRNDKWEPESIEKWHESKRRNRDDLKFKVRLAMAGVHSRQQYKTCRGKCVDGSLCMVRLKIYEKNDFCGRHKAQAIRTAPPAPKEAPARPLPARPATTAPPAPARRLRVPPSPFSKRRNG